MSSDSSFSSDGIYSPAAPFNSRDADVIFRSSDGVEFRLLAAFLSVLSPVFRDMLTRSTPASSRGDTLPVIQVTETAITFEKALHFFYPGGRPDVKTPSELWEILMVLLTKYDVKSVIPTAQQHLERYLTSDPFSVYAVAHTFQWEELALEAAKETLKIPLRDADLDTPAPRELNIPASTYYNLLAYHRSCAVAAEAETRSVEYDSDYVWFHCTSCDIAPRWYLSDGPAQNVSNWFEVYLSEIGGALRQTPCINLGAHKSIFNALKAASKCNTCGAQVFDQFLQWVTDSLQPQIDAAIEEIEFSDVPVGTVRQAVQVASEQIEFSDVPVGTVRQAVQVASEQIENSDDLVSPSSQTSTLPSISYPSSYLDSDDPVGTVRQALRVTIKTIIKIEQIENSDVPVGIPTVGTVRQALQVAIEKLGHYDVPISTVRQAAQVCAEPAVGSTTRRGRGGPRNSAGGRPWR
ncbi:hypothetical protein R3P38DRAFT_2665443 [Favolaschia claudopus]|uniref:BTB domain-containing protein n=1 Tax=Favolaschia claudopus TaxID=2862362 RepID=A0AAV9ZF08_9AGAR